MNVVLRVIAGPHAGEDYVFDRHDTFVVGRSSQAQFPVPEDKWLSRDHFLIEFSPPVCFLKDLGSTNGTRINGASVDEARLQHGDVIEAGHSQFQILVHSTQADFQVIRCRACQAEPSSEISIVVDPSDKSIGWLCDDCRDHRRRFPQPPPGYWIEQKLGGGGMGDVYHGRNLLSGKPVAIKMMIPTAAAGDRALLYFRREVEILRRLQHPHIVQYLDMIEDAEGQFHLIMEYVEGRNAREWIKAGDRPVPIGAIARIGVQLLSALDHAHAQGFVHRDIKPSNLLLTGPEHALDVKLSDFGLAKSFRGDAGLAGITHRGDIGGSSGFLSPDHIRDFREVREPGDIYSAGATLYYLLTRKYPFLDFDPNRNTAYTMILEHPPVPLRVHRPDAPEGLDKVLRKSLEKQPRDRWKSAAAMAQALRPYMDEAT